jgi:hypothetical protein
MSLNPPAKSPSHGSSGRSDLQSYFKVQRVDKSFRQAVPRRKSAVRPFKGVSNYDANWMKVMAYEHAGNTQYNQCWTGEMASRPIPFVSTDSKPKYAQELMEKHLDAVFDFLLPTITPGVQPINKISSLGYPINANPGTGLDERGVQIFQSKFDVVLDEFRIMQGGDFSKYDSGYHTIGVRLQNEPPSKERQMQFITSSGVIIERTITATDREIIVPELGTMIGSRTRTIVRPPVLNLYLQCWDSLIHSAIMKHPLCDADVYNAQEFPRDSKFITFDCKHYERYLGMAALTYASKVGGIYGEKLTMMIKYPFIVPSDDFRAFYEVTPQFKEGVYPQFSSGLSPVAPLGKLTNICGQVEYFVTQKGMSQRDAVQTVFSGVSQGLRRWMYGDDNRALGDPAEMRRYVNFMATIFDIEEDDRWKYLGMVWVPETGRFMLPAETYNTKLYQPERDFSFKDYPFLGMVERRQVFSVYGEPIISGNIIPYENSLWDAIEIPWHTIVADAAKERMRANASGQKLDSYLLTDKEYLATDAERIASGRYWHLTPDEVASVVVNIVGPSIKERLTFKDAPFVQLRPKKLFTKPYIQNDSIIKQTSEDGADGEDGGLS